MFSHQQTILAFLAVLLAACAAPATPKPVVVSGGGGGGGGTSSGGGGGGTSSGGGGTSSGRGRNVNLEIRISKLDRACFGFRISNFAFALEEELWHVSPGLISPKINGTRSR